ncbi:hypothetical protein N7534_001264 [Penicillium rubens]|nr:hypothetical protein N7534_001264 [Penicillium rubens]
MNDDNSLKGVTEGNALEDEDEDEVEKRIPKAENLPIALENSEGTLARTRPFGGTLGSGAITAITVGR